MGKLLILAFLAGAALLVVFSMTASLVQLIVPDHLRGRVMSIYMVAFRGGMPLGSLASGFLASRASAPRPQPPDRNSRAAGGWSRSYHSLLTLLSSTSHPPVMGGKNAISRAPTIAASARTCARSIAARITRGFSNACA